MDGRRGWVRAVQLGGYWGGGEGRWAGIGRGGAQRVSVTTTERDATSLCVQGRAGVVQDATVMQQVQQ